VQAESTPRSEAAKRNDRAEAIVLGCAGMVDFAGELADRHALPVVDGVNRRRRDGRRRSPCLGLTTSKLGGYAFPLPKRIAGSFGA